jgi:hypothetical protein
MRPGRAADHSLLLGPRLWKGRATHNAPVTCSLYFSINNATNLNLATADQFTSQHLSHNPSSYYSSPRPFRHSTDPSVPTVHLAQSQCCSLKTPLETFTAFRKKIHTYVFTSNPTNILKCSVTLNTLILKVRNVYVPYQQILSVLHVCRHP